MKSPGCNPTRFFGELLRKLVPKPLVMPLAQEVDIRANCYVGKITENRSRVWCVRSRG